MLTQIGLSLVPDFVSADEEAEIISQILKTDLRPTGERNSVQRYGRYRPTIRNVTPEIPAFLDALAGRIHSLGLLPFRPDVVAVNEYYPGQGINPHIDSKDNDGIITILGLGSHTVMDFTLGKRMVPVFFPPRTLLQMRDEVRHRWYHSIKARTSDLVEGARLHRGKRYSLVFRRSDL